MRWTAGGLASTKKISALSLQSSTSTYTTTQKINPRLHQARCADPAEQVQVQ